MSYIQFPIQDFKNRLRNFTELNEDDIQLFLKQSNSKIKTYKIAPGAYTFEDLAEVLSRGFESEFEIREKCDRIVFMINPIQFSSSMTLA